MPGDRGYWEFLAAAVPGDLPDTLIPDRPAWMADAACREHPEIDFVPHPRQSAVYRESVARALAVCRGCLVAGECLGYAMADQSLIGIWGGKTAEERAALVNGGVNASQRRRAS